MRTWVQAGKLGYLDAASKRIVRSNVFDPDELKTFKKGKGREEYVGWQL